MFQLLTDAAVTNTNPWPTYLLILLGIPALIAGGLFVFWIILKMIKSVFFK